MICNILIYFWYFFERPSTKWDVLFREITFYNHRVNHGTSLEVIWTTIPALILISIAFPSFSLLYSMDEVMMPAFTLKVIGHQWYWSYEYTDQNNIDLVKSIFSKNFFIDESEIDFDLSILLDGNISKFENLGLEEKVELLEKLSFDFFHKESFVNLDKMGSLVSLSSLVNLNSNQVVDSVFSFYDLIAPKAISSIDFDSYMIPESDLFLGDRRMLEVTEAVVLPINTYVRLLITSIDVLHSFSVNSLGIKADAIPGRLNQLSIYLKRSGVFYGQCSEICGVSHGMMPIVIRGVSLEDYIKWLVSMGSKS